MSKSVMTHKFSRVPTTDIPRSTFDRSHGVKTTFDADVLVPVLVDEILPGDTFKCSLTAFARMATPIYPLMDNLFLDTFWFFVPNRLTWSNWKRFMGERDSPGDSIDYTVPALTSSSSFLTGQNLTDYMGIPTTASSQDVNVLPFRAYWKIYDDWFRDQNLQNSPEVNVSNSAQVIDNSTDYTWHVLPKRGKRHDYFTSCLPTPQKGDSVSLPLGTSAEIHTDAASGANVEVYSTSNTAWRLLDANLTNVDLSTSAGLGGPNILYADLSNATAATINQLRQAFQVQKLLERDNRSGTRYVEMVHAHFGVRDAGGDARMNRPEYLGGSSDIVRVTPIAQTSSTDATSPQGNLSAMGTVSINSGFTRSFTEHGYLICLVNVRADLTYQQGLNRMWSRSTRYDFYFPVLNNIGEQAVLNKEIYTDGTSQDDDVFGYQERFGEYRFFPSQITGLFRSNASGSLDAWHVSQDFGSRPALNASFIESNTPMDRVIAVTTEPHFIFDGYFDMKCTRPMPLYGVPGLIDHF